MNKIILIVGLFAISFSVTGCEIKKSSVTRSGENSLRNSPEVTKIDNIWNEYHNKTVGYTLRFPAEYVITDGECVQNPTRPVLSYKNAFTKSQLLELDTKAFIIPSLRYLITNNECISTPLNEQNAEKNTDEGWHIFGYTATSQEDINNKVQVAFGIKCSLEVLKPTNTKNEYDVVIKRGNECDLKSYFGKYNDKTKSLVLIKFGDSFVFAKDENKTNYYDESMINSFKFD